MKPIACILTSVSLSTLLGWAASAQIPETPTWSASTGAGAFALSSSKAREFNKEGFSFAIEGEWNRVFKSRLRLTATGGLMLIAIEGKDASSVQSVFQQSLTSDQSLVYPIKTYGHFGLGFRHLFAPGSGLEYSEPDAGIWTLFAGPRYIYDWAESPIFLKAAVDFSMNLGVGSSTSYFVGIGYRFGSVAAQAIAPQESPARPIQEPIAEQTAPIVEPVVSAPTASKEFTLDSQVLQFNAGKNTLIDRSKGFLTELGYVLTISHPNEWIEIELRCSRPAVCAETRKTLAGIGIPQNRVLEGGAIDQGVRLTLRSKSISLVALLETKRNQWQAKQVRVLSEMMAQPDRLTQDLQKQMVHTFEDLRASRLSWKSVTITLPQSKKFEDVMHIVRGLATRADLTAVNFTLANESQDRTLEIAIESTRM